MGEKGKERFNIYIYDPKSGDMKEGPCIVSSPERGGQIIGVRTPFGNMADLSGHDSAPRKIALSTPHHLFVVQRVES